MADRKPRFAKGDRVGLWNRPENGTVTNIHFDGAKELVSVVWDSDGSSNEYRAYQLAFATEGRS